MIGSVRWHRVLLCAAVTALLYLPALGRAGLWEPDEGRYAEIAREMVLSGDYVTPRNDWVRYFEKPPFQYWATAASIKLLGQSEFAVRLPAALTSIAEVAVTEALGEAMFGAEVGLLGALALALSPLFFGYARFATPDPALAFFITAGLAAFYMAARAPDFGRGSGRLWFILSAALLALGTLVKGPIALLLAGAIGLIYILAEGRGREIARIPWIGCALAYSIIAVPWFVLVAMRNPGFLRFFFIHEHVQRYLDSTEHGWGPYFFVMVVGGGMWPWLYFMPLGATELRQTGTGSTDPRRKSAIRFLLIWFGLIFVFFSIPRSKLGSYILPAIAPLAIIAGLGLSRLRRLSTKRMRRMLGGFLLLNAMFAATAIGVFAWIGWIRHRLPTALATDGMLVGVCFFLGAAGAFLIVRRGRSGHAAVAAIAIGTLAVMGVMAKAREDAAPLGSYRELARAVKPHLADSRCVLASYRHFVQSLPFYTGRREALVAYRSELAPFSESAGAKASFIDTDGALSTLWRSKCVVLIANRKDLPHLAGLLTPRRNIIGCEGKKVALYNGSPEGRTPADCGKIP
jgi:4-amino-4-deoxy-L-arabinose transferase-like glycosyltransferase